MTSTSLAPDVYVLPTSFGQWRLWFLEQWESGTSVYNVPLAYRLHGPLDVAIFRRCLEEVVRRHEVLRTTFGTRDGVPVQLVTPETTVSCPVIDVPEGRDQETELHRLISAANQQVFDLKAGPLFCARLFRMSAEDHVLSVTIHHIVADGVSLRILVRELEVLYNAFRNGQQSSLPELDIQFGDFAQWQREWLTDEEVNRQCDYWKKRLSDLSPLELPTDWPRPPRQTFPGAIAPVVVPAAVSAALKHISLQNNATVFMTLAAAFEVLLHRYSGQDDIALGIPTAGRNRPELQNLIGFFVNTLVLRADFAGDKSFIDLLSETRQAALNAYAHADVPFERLVETLQVQRDMSRSPLFQVMFAMQAPSVAPAFDGLDAHEVLVHNGTAKFDLTLYLSETDDGLKGGLEYNTDLFDASAIQRLIANFLVLLEGIAKTPDAKVSRLPMLTDKERSHLLVACNDTASAYPHDQSVAALIEAQVARTPDAVAVSFEGKTLTYAELNARANALADTLRSLGVRPSVLVGICVERSAQMVVGLLAILKAGAAYVPLDPAFPPERLKFMLEDSGAPVLLTDTQHSDLLPTDNVKVICLDTLETPGIQTTNYPDMQAGPDDLAYVLYTSGSTGKPKGVEITHRALTNFLWAMRTEPGCTDRDAVLALTTLSFDIAGLELYLPLIVGARIELASRQVATDGWLLKALIDKAQPTVLQATPASWRMLIAAGWTGTPGLKALIGGEPLPPDLVAPLLARTSSLWNMYGPTETTIWSSVQQVTSADEEITVGRPIANTQFYVLDTTLQPTPIGVPGELFIGGDGLARGYRGRPELTAERFIADPFSSGQGARLYRTGDRARFRADGRVVHMGRLDHQVKVRGFRIELGEIEAVLGRHETVAQNCVMVRQDEPGEAVLAAYVVPRPGHETSAVDLRQHLKAAVPDYMVPQHIVFLEAFPLTPNGKIDRKRLPAPNPSERAAESFVAPRTPVEEAICSIWTDLLGVPRVGIHDDFFELGGHSLRAVELVRRITERFGAQIPLQTLFEAATVATLADKVCALTGLPRAEAVESPADPRTIERVLTIWEEILARPVGTRDSFLELQGERDLLEPMLAAVRSAFPVLAEGLPVDAFLEDPTVERLAKLLSWSSGSASSLVVCLQPAGAKPPLFLIHAGGGYVFFYRAMASRFKGERPVYAVRAETDADGLGRPFDQSGSTEELASRYITEIKKIQPAGPYHLGGACFGGVIALEMARQLREQGETLEGPLLLFESYVDNNPKAGKKWDDLGPSGSWLKLTRLVSDPIGVLTRRLNRMGLAPKKFARESAEYEESKSFLHATERLIRQYKPSPYDGELVLFKAKDGPDPELLWTDLGVKGLTVHTMPGTHLEMMDEPLVGDVVDNVRSYLA